jgi:hypothetical protein
MAFAEGFWWWFAGISIPLALAVWSLRQAVRHRTTGNLFGTLLCGFLSTTLVWLSLLGLQALSLGWRIPLSPSSYKLGLVLALLLMMAAFHGLRWNWRRIGAFLAAVAATAGVGVLSALGLSVIHWRYIRKYAFTWLMVSLCASLGFQLLFHLLRQRRRGE